MWDGGNHVMRHSMQARFQERAFLFQKIGFELAVDLQMCLGLFFFLEILNSIPSQYVTQVVYNAFMV